jgi:hypothetical protein
MKWVTALALGAILGFVLPTGLDVRSGVWMNSWASWGTIHPHAGSPGLLFSIPVVLGSALALRLGFNWHTR